MQVTIAWRRPLSPSQVVALRFSALTANLRITYWPNLSWGSGRLPDLISADRVQPPTGSVSAKPTPAQVTLRWQGQPLVDAPVASRLPWAIGLPLSILTPADRQTTNDRVRVDDPLIHLVRVPKAFVRFVAPLRDAVLKRGQEGALTDLVALWLERVWQGDGEDGLQAASRKLPEGARVETLVAALASLILLGSVDDTLLAGERPPMLGHESDPTWSSERVIDQPAEWSEALIGLIRLDGQASFPMDYLQAAFRQLPEALAIFDEAMALRLASYNADLLDDAVGAKLPEIVAATVVELAALMREVIRNGSVLSLEAVTRTDLFPADILDDLDDAISQSPDPFEEIWRYFEPGHDDIVVPDRAYDYAKQFERIVEPVTGRVLEPLSDPTQPDVEIRVPPENPFPFADERRRRVIPLYVLSQLMKVITFYRNAESAQLATLTVPEALQQTLSFLYGAIRNRFAGLALEPDYLRGFRLVRWYAERTLYEHGRYLLGRSFNPWVAPIPAGYLDVPWTGNGITMLPGRIQFQGDAALRVDVPVQVSGQVRLTVTIPPDATAVLHRTAGDITLVNGNQTVMLASADPIDLRVQAPTTPVELTQLERDGYLLQEYTIMPIFQPGAAATALDDWQARLTGYYRRHHEHKTKGTRFFHLNS